MLDSILAPEPDYFVVDLRIKPTNNIKLFLDGDEGITIEKCVRINRALYKMIEEAGLYPEGDFSLEVSSAGLDEPLKLPRQYKKNIGRAVEVLLQDGARIDGKLLAADTEGVVIEQTKRKLVGGRPTGKKQEPVSHTISFNNIKTIKIQVVF